MSQESMLDLNRWNLSGFTEQRAGVAWFDAEGRPWHYREALQGEESTVYPGAIPIEDVRRRLFYWKALEGTVTTDYIDEDGQPASFVDPSRKTIIRPDTQTIPRKE